MNLRKTEVLTIRKKIFLKYFVIWNTILYVLMLMYTSNWQGVGPVPDKYGIYSHIYIFFFWGGGGVAVVRRSAISTVIKHS